MMKELKAFALRGNVVDMAVGIVIGGAFGKIVSSFVADVIMPPLGMLLGGVNFADLAITLKQAGGEVAAVTLNYGKFIQSMVDFVIIAFAIFMVIKGMNSMKKKEEAPAPAAPPAPPKEEVLLTEIRDLLKQK
jgi:large conductance mechanosensitive channel